MQLRYAQSADVITITHPDYPPRKIIRKGATEWTTEIVTVGYGLAQPQNLNGTVKRLMKTGTLSANMCIKSQL